MGGNWAGEGIHKPRPRVRLQGDVEGSVSVLPRGKEVHLKLPEPLYLGEHSGVQTSVRVVAFYATFSIRLVFPRRDPLGCDLQPQAQRVRVDSLRDP